MIINKHQCFLFLLYFTLLLTLLIFFTLFSFPLFLNCKSSALHSPYFYYTVTTTQVLHNIQSMKHVSPTLKIRLTTYEKQKLRSEQISQLPSTTSLLSYTT